MLQQMEVSRDNWEHFSWANPEMPMHRALTLHPVSVTLVCCHFVTLCNILDPPSCFHFYLVFMETCKHDTGTIPTCCLLHLFRMASTGSTGSANCSIYSIISSVCYINIQCTWNTSLSLNHLLDWSTLSRVLHCFHMYTVKYIQMGRVGT